VQFASSDGSALLFDGFKRIAPLAGETFRIVDGLRKSVNNQWLH
jgi:hypothetical protein